MSRIPQRNFGSLERNFHIDFGTLRYRPGQIQYEAGNLRHITGHIPIAFWDIIQPFYKSVQSHWWQKNMCNIVGKGRCFFLRHNGRLVITANGFNRYWGLRRRNRLSCIPCVIKIVVKARFLLDSGLVTSRECLVLNLNIDCGIRMDLNAWLSGISLFAGEVLPPYLT